MVETIASVIFQKRAHVSRKMFDYPSKPVREIGALVLKRHHDPRFVDSRATTFASAVTMLKKSAMECCKQSSIRASLVANINIFTTFSSSCHLTLCSIRGPTVAPSLYIVVFTSLRPPFLANSPIAT